MMTIMTPPIEALPVSAPLEYAPARHVRRRVRRILRITLGVILVALIASIVYWRAPLWAHAQLHFYQRQCANFTQSPDVVIASSRDKGIGLSAAPIPDSWTAYQAMAPALPPGVLRALARNPNRLSLAFLHRLKSPSGHERIVAVFCEPTYLTSASVTQALQFVVIEPASFWSLSSRPVLHAGGWRGGYPTRRKIDMFAGQPDPADPSKFTIAYTVEGQPGVVEGQLNDDNTVTLELRNGSAMVMDRTSN